VNQEDEDIRRTVINMIKASMIRDGASLEFVNSIEHKSISELYPGLMELYRMRQSGRIFRETMPPLRYEQLGRDLRFNYGRL
jgi:hypothetical protein